VLNYAPVLELLKGDDGFVDGVVAEDSESGERFQLRARCVVNATGVFTDEIRQMADANVKPMVAPSQGIHLVLDKSFLRGNAAIMVPHTSDGRVLFAIPWHEHTVLGTTDTPIEKPVYEPVPFEKEIDFTLETAGEYLSRKPTRADVLSVYVGIRPLVKAADSDSSKTSSLSRDHTIQIDPSGLLTIVGGKWTTYRHMAEDTVNHAITLGKLEDKPCVTATLRIHGYQANTGLEEPFFVYGTDAEKIRALADESPELAKRLHPDLPYIAAEIIWAAREEMARSIEDALARRTRALFLNAHAAIAMAPAVANLLAKELNKNEQWKTTQIEAFTTLAAQYRLQKTTIEKSERAPEAAS
jgi:glycerol-3-phosphate dehydrogenase